MLKLEFEGVCNIKNGNDESNIHVNSYLLTLSTYNIFCSAKQMTGFYMKCYAGLKWVNIQNFNMKIVMLCAIWHHLYNLKNVKNTHGGVILLVMLQAALHFSNFLPNIIIV